MATSISYSSTAAGGKTLSKSITDINPNVSNEVAKTFTQKLNALTTNTLSGINRIDKTEIDPDIVYTPVTAAWDSNPGTHLTLDGLTVNFDNQANIDEAGLMFYCNGEPINVGSFEFRPSDPANNRYFLGNFANTDMSTQVTRIGLSIAAFMSQAPAGKVDVICPGGSVTKDGTTYYYAPFTLTLNYAAKA